MHLIYKNKGLLFFTLRQILTTEIFYCPEGDDDISSFLELTSFCSPLIIS